MQTTRDAKRLMISEAAGILAAGILRVRRREIKQATEARGFLERGLDVSGNVSIHCNERGQGGDR